MSIAMMMNLSSGTMVKRPGRLKKPQEKKGPYPLLGIHQGTGIGVSPRMRKKK